MGANNRALKAQTGPVPYGAAPGVVAPAAPAPAANTWTNEGAVPDYLMGAVKRLEGRSDASNTARAIDKSNAGIADSAALLAKDAKANMGSRGVMGTGVGNAYLQKNVFQPAQRMAAKGASDISQGEQTRLDNLALGGTAVLTAPSQIALANQGLNLQQQGQQQNFALQQQQLKMQQDEAEMAKYRALMQMGGTGAATGGGTAAAIPAMTRASAGYVGKTRLG